MDIKYGSSQTTREFVDKLKLSDAKRAELAAEIVPTAFIFIRFATKIISNGGNIHRSNVKTTRKRRARNKVARRQRKVNRGT